MHIFYPAIVPGESFVLLELQKQAVKNKDYRLNEPSQSSLPITPQTY
jgi:hypothetical protein